MNIIIIDDFKPIVETIHHNIHWEKLGIQEVYQATSAKQAKLILANFKIDIMLCDIEMPEENGLELFAWSKEHFPTIECIFLTSHADFDYALSAIKLGSFDYVLQPAKFEDIENAIIKATEKILKEKQYNRFQEASGIAGDQFDSILEIMQMRREQHRYEDVDMVCNEYIQFLSSTGNAEYEVRQMLLTIEKWNKISQKQTKRETKNMFHRSVLSLFDAEHVKVAVAALNENDYWILVIAEKDSIPDQLWTCRINDLQLFLNEKLEITVSIYSCVQALKVNYAEAVDDFFKEAEIKHEFSGVHILNGNVVAKASSMNQQVEQAIGFIRNNLSVNITRADVAREVGLSEEYFSRLFKKETGETFKDYVVSLKINEAKRLLDHTSLSVGIIASKVGYSNFSHFSKSFRDVTGLSPVDYKKREKKY